MDIFLNCIYYSPMEGVFLFKPLLPSSPPHHPAMTLEIPVYSLAFENPLLPKEVASTFRILIFHNTHTQYLSPEYFPLKIRHFELYETHRCRA